MSIARSFTQRPRQAAPRTLVAAEIRYVTNGTRIFRRTTTLNRCPAGFVWLEDCRLLSVVLATEDEVARLTPVYADADDDPEPQ